MKRAWLAAKMGAVPIFLLGCAIHPKGEDEEQARSEAAGAAFQKVYDDRSLPPLAEDASAEEVLRRALLQNAALEARWWEWRAALEEVPQEGSPRTTAALFFDHLLEGGSATFWDRTELMIGNDPMNNIPWPGKLATRARRALEKARAAGLRFEEARFALQEETLSRWAEWTLLAEMIRLEEANLSLLETIALAAEGRTRAGTGPQQDLLKARTQRDLSQNALHTLRSRVPGLRARINALLSRPPASPLALPSAQPEPRPFPHGDEDLLALIFERNPGLAAAAREEERNREGIVLAKKEWIPEFGISAGGDLGGMAQSVAGMVTLPLLRYEALRAGVAQARAELRAAQAMRRAAKDDLGAEVALALAGLRDADRQLALFRDAIIPRAEEIIATTRAAYATGQVPLVELLDSQRTLLEARTARAELRAEHETLAARLESLAALAHGSGSTAVPAR